MLYCEHEEHNRQLGIYLHLLYNESVINNGIPEILV